MGDLDLVYNIPGVKQYIQGGGFKKDVPLLDEVVVLEGVAHFLNQEKPDEINQHILEYIKKFWFTLAYGFGSMEFWILLINK